MATDDGHDFRRKHHHSSSPEDADRSSKRHRRRHRHHRRHRHRRRRRHGSRKPDEESERDCETVAAVPSPNPPSSLGTNRRVPDDDDVEEGEILEEDDGDVAKQHAQSDAEPGEIDVTGVRVSDSANLGLLVKETLLRAKDFKTRRQCDIDDEFISPDGEDGTCRRSHVGRGIHEDGGFPSYSSDDPQDGKDGRAGTDGMGNGLLDHKSLKGDKRHSGEDRCLKRIEKLKGYFDGDGVEVGGKVGYYRNSSSESGGEKYRRSRRSYSRDRYRSRSRSSGHARDRSRSGSIVEEYAHSKIKDSGEQGGLSHTSSRPKIDYDLDDERMVGCRRENRDLVVDKRREHRASYHIREAWGRNRSRDRDVDRDLKMEK